MAPQTQQIVHAHKNSTGFSFSCYVAAVCVCVCVGGGGGGGGRIWGRGASLSWFGKMPQRMCDFQSVICAKNWMSCAIEFVDLQVCRIISI